MMHTASEKGACPAASASPSPGRATTRPHQHNPSYRWRLWRQASIPAGVRHRLPCPKTGSSIAGRCQGSPRKGIRGGGCGGTWPKRGRGEMGGQREPG